MIGLGSNLGDRKALIESAIRALSAIGSLKYISSLYESPAWGWARAPKFLNAVVMLDTHTEPQVLLHYLMAVEQHHGRVRRAPNAPRTLDLDLLDYGQQTIQTKLLQAPHPRMWDRLFVLMPLNEIQPDYHHPTERTHIADQIETLMASTPKSEVPVLFTKTNGTPVNAHQRAQRTKRHTQPSH
ncbi:MAG: 2-amino-4-hydroxy-6-hydroxymethyldihydropteridine diphosphokinase [Acidobacteria bacterium]|nr:2-amino-4-hydroxy-6-hydroxymethyldihydropteridine diphosphokinase [Acidobacteriota bacterium]